MLPKKHRISKKDFDRIYKQGQRAKGDFGMLVGLKDTTSDSPRFGFVVNKKVGNAVVRHAVTRKLRAVVMEYLKENPLISPILFQYIAFKREYNYMKLREEMYKQIDEVIKKLG